MAEASRPMARSRIAERYTRDLLEGLKDPRRKPTLFYWPGKYAIIELQWPLEIYTLK